MSHIDSLPHARPNLLAYNVVCSRLGISKSTFHNLADSGALGPVYRIGVLKKITERGLEEYIQRMCNVEQVRPAAAHNAKKTSKPRAKRQACKRAG